LYDEWGWLPRYSTRVFYLGCYKVKNWGVFENSGGLKSFFGEGFSKMAGVGKGQQSRGFFGEHFSIK
jgi:hypothetical protein